MKLDDFSPELTSSDRWLCCRAWRRRRAPQSSSWLLQSTSVVPPSPPVLLFLPLLLTRPLLCRYLETSHNIITYLWSNMKRYISILPDTLEVLINSEHAAALICKSILIKMQSCAPSEGQTVLHSDTDAALLGIWFIDAVCCFLVIKYRPKLAVWISSFIWRQRNCAEEIGGFIMS